MGQICLMSEALANQIAAGEVVERPASCIKELIENSVDASAKRIDVALQDGGISSMEVQDDGVGMDEADALLAFSRHATSKLVQPRDLFSISTLGFRGEALASIAAVSRVTLQTRQRAAEQGTEVVVQGTEVSAPPHPVGMNAGTRIEVRDLFFNTPARLKYLRTVTTEQTRCIEVIQRMAIARPDIAFQLSVNGNRMFQSSGRGDLLEVLATLYGVGEARQMLGVAASTPDYHVTGYVGRPNQAKASRAHSYLFVNGRPIRNIALQQAVESAYQGRLMANRYPVFALHIVLDPKLVDVNIHPHKAEVRFSEERDLVQVVQQAVRGILGETFLVPEVKGFVDSRRPVSQPEQVTLPLSPLGRTRERPPAPMQPPRSASRPSDVKEALDVVYAPVHPGRDEVASTGEPGVVVSETAVTVDDVPEVTTTLRPASWRLRPVGQALGMYIVADDGENLYIIDQHAAHERVLYERFRARMMSEEVATVPLLTPLTLELVPSRVAAMQRWAEVLGDLGLETEPFGGRSYVLRTVPVVWEGLDVLPLVEAVLEALDTQHSVPDVRDALREVIVMRACKAAIKANRWLSSMEMDALCEALTELDDPFHCPHGRPVLIRMSSRDLEKEFRRIV